MKDHSCQYPYCIRTALTVACPKCGAWLCQKHFPLECHDCEKLSTWQTAGASLNAIKGLRPEDIKAGKDGIPKLHVELTDDLEWKPDPAAKAKPTRKDWKKIVPK